MLAPSHDGRVRFGPFELDLSCNELRKRGHRIRIQQQPLRVLALLMERPGHLVTRDELRSRLWPNGLYVDFEHGLNRSVNKLRRALLDSADSPRYIETLPTLGYRFIAPVEMVLNGAKEVKVHAEPETESVTMAAPLPSLGNFPATTASRSSISSSPRRIISFVLLLAVAGAGIAAVGLVFGIWRLRSSGTTQIDSVAVLPFVNAAADANNDYLSDGITEGLIRNLAHVPDLKVKSRTSVFEYKPTNVDIPKVGRDLGVSALVSGRVVPRGDVIEVSAELINARDNTEIWEQHYSCRSAEIVSLQQRIASDIAQKLRATLTTSERRRIASQGTQSPDAHQAYLKGRYYWNKRTVVDLERAISYFNQAIAKDPYYALAYSGLADVYVVLSTYGGNPKETYAKATAAAFRALELDSSLARPHAVLGCVEMEYDWDFAAGEAEYKKALELDPDDATAHHWYAQDIGWLGRSDEAIAQVNLAHQLEPTSLMVTTEIGMVDLTARKFDEAIAICRKVLNENPAFAQAHSCLALAYWGKRDYPKGIEEWKAFGQLSREQNFAEWATAMEQGFRSGNWKGALRKTTELQKAQRKKGYVSAYYLGAFYADLGDRDQAFRWLDVAFQERDVFLLNLPTDYLLDSIRSDPRFAELSRKMGLPR